MDARPEIERERGGASEIKTKGVRILAPGLCALQVPLRFK
jgi:hypothetical protein